MARIKIAEIPGKIVSYWDDRLECVIDCWENFHLVTPDDLQSILIEKVIPFLRTRKTDTHIVDNSKANGAFSPECVRFFKDVVTLEMQKTYVRIFVTISSQTSSLANISMKNLRVGDTEVTFYAIDADTFDGAIKALASAREMKKAS